MDIFARSLKADDYSIIGEVKNREFKKFSIDELKEFELNFAEIKKRENLGRESTGSGDLFAEDVSNR